MACRNCNNGHFVTVKHTEFCSRCKKVLIHADERVNMSHVCIKCKEDPWPKTYSNDGVKEVYISGLCEMCFDQITMPPEEAEA